MIRPRNMIIVPSYSGKACEGRMSTGTYPSPQLSERSPRDKRLEASRRLRSGRKARLRDERHCGDKPSRVVLTGAVNHDTLRVTASAAGRPHYWGRPTV